MQSTLEQWQCALRSGAQFGWQVSQELSNIWMTQNALKRLKCLKKPAQYGSCEWLKWWREFVVCWTNMWALRTTLSDNALSLTTLSVWQLSQTTKLSDHSANTCRSEHRKNTSTQGAALNHLSWMWWPQMHGYVIGRILEKHRHLSTPWATLRAEAIFQTASYTES